MLSAKQLKDTVSAVVDFAHPSKIILFGSYARGEADDESDLDLLVIKPKVKNKGMEMVGVRHAIGNLGIGVDVLVYSEEEVDEWGHLPGGALYWALKEGKLLYEAPY